MQVNFTFRNFDSSDLLKSHAEEKLAGLRKYLDHASEADVVFSIEKHQHNVDVLVHAGPFFLRGRDRSEDMYASIGAAVEKIERQLKRYKERLRQHKGSQRGATLRVRQHILEVPAAPEPEAQPQPTKVVESKELVARRMSVDEALLQLELAENDFLVFTNAETGHVAVLYRRKDAGSFGLIDARAS